MNRLLLLLIVCLCPTWAMAQGCDVKTRSQSPSVPVIETHSCYEYEGMPVDSIDWSCSNESKEMLTSTKKKSRTVRRSLSGHLLGHIDS